MGVSQERDRNLDHRFHLSKSPPWKFFSSLRLAITLILILVALSLIGTFVIQVPSDIKASAVDYSWWLENIANPQTGFWYPLINSLGLFDVFHSFWFLGAGSLLIVSIIVCSLNRLPQTKANMSLNTLRLREEQDKSSIRQTVLLNTPSKENAGELIAGLLKKHHYNIILVRSDENIFLAAGKNRYSPWGTYLIHLSLILIIAGFLMSSYLGFRDSAFVVPEGVTRNIGNNTNLALQLISFTDEYWPDGSPKEYRSEVIIYDSGTEVGRGVTRVNHPLSYNGVRIHQSFFGPAVTIQINDSKGNELFKGNIALSGILENHPYQRPSGGFRLTQKMYSIFLVGRATNIDDPVLRLGQIGLEVYNDNSAQPIASSKIDKGIPFKTEDLEFTYIEDSQFSGFQISRDPGSSLIWIASGLLLLGLVIVFYFPRRRIWASLQPGDTKGYRLYLRTDARLRHDANQEIQKLVNEIVNLTDHQKDSGKIKDRI
jgi:cytochrome c biogenesis protein